MESQRTLIQKRTVPLEQIPLERYQLLDKLGEGGFGTVWRAHDELLHRHVAVKRIHLDPDGHSERAVREAKASARLKHPAIVSLYEAVVHDDAIYLISELVEGDTLARLIAADELADEDVLEIGLALADALLHAHARGVIHRDIKPQNVLIPDEPEESHSAAKLTDFGGASLIGADVLTRTGDVYGTLAYMAPEQANGHDVHEQADLYSLALVLYEAFSGVNPVRGATPAATARRIGRPLEPLARQRRDLPREFTRALDTALAPNPNDRGTLEELRDELHNAHQRGLSRSRWRRAAAPPPPPRRESERRAAAEDSRTQRRAAEAPHTADATELDPDPVRRRRPIVPYSQRASPPPLPPHSSPDPADELTSAEREAPRVALPRALWLAAALAAIAWQAFAGRPGVALLAAAALAPLLAMPSERGSSRIGGGWLLCALAPILGLVSLAGAFPALAGQARRWPQRAARGALGYWWLTLAAPLLARTLWLSAPAGVPARAAWEGSLQSAAAHVLGPMFTLGVALGALLWGCAALLLPWIVRGRSAVVDLLAVAVWSAAVALAAPPLDGGLSAQHTPPSPHGLVLGALVGGMAALAARALRGPV